MSCIAGLSYKGSPVIPKISLLGGGSGFPQTEQTLYLSPCSTTVAQVCRPIQQDSFLATSASLLAV
jgi:hypothetical protein